MEVAHALWAGGGCTGCDGNIRRVTVSEQENWIDFKPDKPKADGKSVLFYPGGLVKPESYAPLAHELAAAGHHTIIAKMPFNLAVIKPNLADDILAAYPEEQFVMGDTR